ncbi:MAG: hypothetical protein K0S47_4221 [Herbinix sp.]|jgi:hypothetical protein|nr:hypothetical protein [Herbinix sp.]
MKSHKCISKSLKLFHFFFYSILIINTLIVLLERLLGDLGWRKMLVFLVITVFLILVDRWIMKIIKKRYLDKND